MSNELTEQQAEQLVRGLAEQKQSIQGFFTNVIKSEDTTKTGNLSQEELGDPKLPVRSIKELELFSKDIYEDTEWSSYFKNLSEIQTATSLSKEGLLLKLSVTTKKEVADIKPAKKSSNRGWFKKKGEGGN